MNRQLTVYEPLAQWQRFFIYSRLHTNTIQHLLMTGEDHLHIIEKEKGAVQQLSFVENRTLMF